MALIVVVILLVATGVRWVYLELGTCGPGVDSIDGQCIGVTDGRVHLTPGLADVLSKIQQENAEVDRSGRSAVSVGYLLALPRPSSNNPFEVALRHELEGAYLAQRVANGTKTGADEPLLRLLIANDGDQSNQWQEVVSTLLDRVDGAERLVAVVATGQTRTGRQQAIAALTAEGVPVIASRLTGDNLTPPDDASPVQGLVRLSPSISDQAETAVAYLKREQPNTRRALLIQNIDPNDGYSQSLGAAFLRAFPDDTHEVLKRIERYNPQLRGWPSTMKGMLPSICDQKPDVILFAGRGPELAELIKALPQRSCSTLPIKFVTANSAVNLVNEIIQGDHELRKGVGEVTSVQYTAAAHPESWKTSPESFAPGPRDYFESSCEKCYRTLFPGEFPGEPLNDGAAILGHDAIAIAIAAIRAGDVINDDPELVIQEFNRLHGPKAVAGASGWISLDNGEPINKAIPILAVKPDGTVAFVQLTSPQGSPCRPEIFGLC
ncbi:MAG: ABC transporter substrate-binding protein [Pseudonocardiaceae bacterium]